MSLHSQQAFESSGGDQSMKAHFLEQSIPAVRFPGSSIPPPAGHPGFYQYPAAMMYPVWTMASCLVPQPFAPPQHPSNSWRGSQQHLSEQAYWQHMRTRAANRKAAGGGSAAGTGVFLPKGQAAEDACEDAVSMASSDVDSLESASDCVMLEEEAPIKRGQLTPTMSIEQLLPDEWEY